MLQRGFIGLEAWLACAALDWNENRGRKCSKIQTMKPLGNSVWRRPAKKRVLSTKTFNWKNVVKQKLSYNESSERRSRVVLGEMNL